MPTTTVCPVAWIQIGSAQADASVRALVISAGSGVTLTTTTASGVATTTIAASGGGGGTPATAVVSATSYGQSPVVGTGTNYGRSGPLDDARRLRLSVVARGDEPPDPECGGYSLLVGSATQPLPPELHPVL